MGYICQSGESQYSTCGWLPAVSLPLQWPLCIRSDPGFDVMDMLSWIGERLTSLSWNFPKADSEARILVQVMYWRGIPGHMGKGWKSDPRKERQSVKGTLSSKLPLQANEASLHWGILENNVEHCHRVIPLEGQRAGVFTHQLLIVLVEDCAQKAVRPER